jgi:riboflavin synthase
LSAYIVPKGSVCLDGVSLTVAALEDNEFEVALIPTTIDKTALAERPIGWPMNFEADIIVKTIAATMGRMSQSRA